MSSTAEIVPLGPDFVVKGRRWVGFIGCHHCDAWQLVRAEKNGTLYAACDNSVYVHVCGDKGSARYGWPADATAPDYTVQDLGKFADDIKAMPYEYKRVLCQSWRITEYMLEGIINGQNIDPAPPENPAEKVGHSKPANPRETAGGPGIGNDPGNDPAGAVEPAGHPEPSERAGSGHWTDEFI